MMRPPVPRTFIVLMCLLDHFPGVVAIMGMPLHCFLMNMVGWLLMRPPILHLSNHRIVSDQIDIFFSFLFLLYSTSYLYIEDGSSLLKSRDGGRSLNISIEKIIPLFLFNNNNQRELLGVGKNQHDKNNQSLSFSGNKNSKVI